MIIIMIISSSFSGFNTKPIRKSSVFSKRILNLITKRIIFHLFPFVLGMSFYLSRFIILFYYQKEKVYLITIDFMMIFQ